MIFQFSAPKPSAGGEQQASDKEDDERISHHQKSFQCPGGFAPFPFFHGQKPEHKRGEEVCAGDNRNHTYNREFGKRPQSRMLGENKQSDSNEKYCGRKHYRLFERCEHPPAVSVFVDQSFGYENRIIVALPENKCRQNDIDDIKPDVENIHQSQNPDPADSERDKCKYGKFDAPKGEKQKDKNDETADIEHVVEIVGQSGNHFLSDGRVVEKEKGGVRGRS